MWTVENRARYDRSRLRYPSDLTDEEWTLAKAEIPRAKRGGNKRTVDVREVLNGLMYVLSSSCQWRAMPKDLPPRRTVNHYFCRWQDDCQRRRENTSARRSKNASETNAGRPPQGPFGVSARVRAGRGR